MRSSRLHVVALLVAGLELTAANTDALAQEVPEAEQSVATRVQLHVDNAKRARDAQDWATTVSEYQRAWMLDRQPKFLFNIGLASQFAGNERAALKAFTVYLKAAPNGRHAAKARARSEALRKRMSADRATTAPPRRKDSEARAHRVPPEVNDDAEAHVQAGLAAENSGQFSAAAVQLRSAYEVGQQPEHLIKSGVLWFRAKKPEESIRTLRHYLARHPNGDAAPAVRKLIASIAASHQSAAHVSDEPAAAPAQPTVAAQSSVTTATRSSRGRPKRSLTAQLSLPHLGLGFSLQIPFSARSAIRGEMSSYGGEDSTGIGGSIGLPLYALPSHLGPFIEPAFVFRSGVETGRNADSWGDYPMAESTAGVQALIGWHWRSKRTIELVIAIGLELSQYSSDAATEASFASQARAGFTF